MFTLQAKLLFALVFTTVLLYYVSGDYPLKEIQKKCKVQNEALRKKKATGTDHCPEYKSVVQCIAQVNYSAVNTYVENADANCTFTDEELRDLQKYKIVSTAKTPMTTQSINSGAGNFAGTATTAIILTIAAVVSVVQVFILFHF